MSEWYKDWFNSAEYLNVYKHRNDQDADELLNLIFSNVQLETGSKILDAACGAGRHSIQLAQKGFKVTGFDLSETLLSVAKKSAKEKNKNVEFLRSDIREFYQTEKFSMIINLFTSFGYFEKDEENFCFYKNAFKMLEKNGYLVLDYFNSNYLRKNLVPETIKIVDQLKITEKREIKNNRVNKKILIEKDGKQKSFTESVRLYDAEKIVEQFREIGFRNFKIFGNFQGAEFDEKLSQRLIIICQK